MLKSEVFSTKKIMILGLNSYWTLGLVIMCQILIVNAGDSVPVLLWGGDGENSSPEPVNPLHKTLRVDFEKILNRKLGKSLLPLLVFKKDNFCVDDITQNKKHLGKLKNAGMIYLPAVESPMTVFENLPSYNLTMEDDLEILADNQLAIIQVTELDSILEFYSRIRETTPNLVAALTGKSCINSRSERVRRAEQTEFNVSNETSLFFNKSNVLVYSSQLPFIKIGTGNSSYEKLESFSIASNVARANNSINVTMTFQSKLDPKITTKFYFILIHGYYKLINLTYTDKNNTTEVSLKSRKEFFIPQHFSYHCGRSIIFSDGVVHFKFIDLQIQLDAKEKFGDTYDCIGFTTIPIWTGIFVTAILALIMIWGLTMIMDIRTMDRFDDPKGKTITISSQE